MKKKFASILAAGLLGAPLVADAELVQSGTSVLMTFRQCVAGATVCDSITAMQQRSFGGLPGEQAAQASQADPAYGESSGSVQLMTEPGAAELIANVTSLPATRNGSSNQVMQRYTNTRELEETLTLDATLRYDMTVPVENADFPEKGGAHSTTIAELEFFTSKADSLDVGTTEEEYHEAMLGDPGPDFGYESLKTASTGPISNVSSEGTKTASVAIDLKPGDSVWLWVGLQSIAANGAVVNARMDTTLVSAAVEKP